MLEAEIYIILKETVSDPQGLAIKHALSSLKYDNVEEVRVGKLIKIKLNSNSEEDAKVILEDMCRKLLANPIIENYSFKLKVKSEK